MDKARDTVKQELRSARDDVQQRAADTVNRQKHRVADRLDAIVHALSAAQESLREDEQPQLARYVDDLTRQVERSTGYLRNNDFGGMMRDMEDLARNSTGVFLGSTFVAGMAMGRFLRSSEPEQPGGELTGDWRGEAQSRGAGAGGTGAYGTGVAGATSAFGTRPHEAGAQQERGAYEGGAEETYRSTTGFQTNAFGSYADRGMHASGAAQGADEARRTGRDRDLEFDRDAGESRGRDFDHGTDATRRASSDDRPDTPGGTAFERDTDATRNTQSDAGTERTRETWGEDR